VTPPNLLPTPSFLDYTPVSLAFGTSGLRGLVTDITDLEAYINVKAALRYLLTTGDVRQGSRVVLAGDLRPSTDRIMRASSRAILDSGFQVENAGKIPTPALISHAVAGGAAGVMVSGSHIPFDRNGIKLSGSKGEILKSDEAGISREVDRVRAEEYQRTRELSAFDASGMLKERRELPPVDRAAEEAYLHRYLTSFPSGGLRGLRILVYQHSAVGRDILPRILRELGADVVTAGRTETFVALDTENVTDEQLVRLEQLAAEAGGSALSAIVSTDGDSDRPLVAAVLPPEKAGRDRGSVRFLPGDLLGIVVAEYLSADAVAVPISANDAVRHRMNQRGILLKRTKIGSPYVIAAIQELLAEKTHRRIVGWEANGGFLTGSDIPLTVGTMSALPTRDAMLPILANLFAAAQGGVDLDTLWNRLPARYGRSGLLDHVPSETSRAMMGRLVPAGEVVEVEFDPSGGVLDRSLQEPAGLPEPAAREWLSIRAALGRVFTPGLGFDDIARINVLDGARISFQNGDVAHVRASGNAPQLRIYANSDAQARADQIVEYGLREPRGILRELLASVGAPP
jgi:phosphomannomutase